MEEKTIFVELFGDSPSIRILNFLLVYREFDYSLTDIAKNSNVAWSTLNLLWPRLEKMRVVKYTRDVGKAKMYKLNTENELVKNLIKFADSIVWEYSIKSKNKKKILTAYPT